MSSHPGSGLNEAIELAEYLQSVGHKPEQVQDFYPTPGTLSTCMYYTGLDPRYMEKVFVPKSQREKTTQRALIQYRSPNNYEIVKAALLKSGRKDLIGHDSKALIRPPRVVRPKQEKAPQYHRGKATLRKPKTSQKKKK